MGSVVAEPEVPAAGGAVPPPPGAPGGPDGPDAPVRMCDACGAPMAADQDWCLNCGTAAPGRLGTRLGGRAAAIAVGLTLLLVGGAVAVGYAALSDDANNEASRPAPPAATPTPGQQAQLPAPAGTPDVATPPAAPTATSPIAPVAPSTTATPPVVPKGSTPVLPSAPVTSAPVTSGPSTSTSTPTTSSGATKTTTSSPSTPTKSTGTSTTKNTTTTPVTTTPPAPTKISLDSTAASLYDPSQRAVSSSDPTNVLDGDAQSAWKVTAPSDGKPMQVGLLVDLGGAKHVSRLDLRTDTPGFRVEVYATDSSTTPPDILDTRWTHVTSRSLVDASARAGNVKGDGKERINFPRDGDTFRKVLLWITTAPASGPTVDINEITLAG